MKNHRVGGGGRTAGVLSEWQKGVPVGRRAQNLEGTDRRKFPETKDRGIGCMLQGVESPGCLGRNKSKRGKKSNGGKKRVTMEGERKNKAQQGNSRLITSQKNEPGNSAQSLPFKGVVKLKLYDEPEKKKDRERQAGSPHQTGGKGKEKTPKKKHQF